MRDTPFAKKWLSEKPKSHYPQDTKRGKTRHRIEQLEAKLKAEKA